MKRRETVATLLNLPSPKKILAPEELGASPWCAAEGRFKPPWRGAAPVFSPHCAQLTLHWLLKQLQLQIKCFTYISWFPLQAPWGQSSFYSLTNYYVLIYKIFLKKKKESNKPLQVCA